MSQKFKAAKFTTLATLFVALSTPAHAFTAGDLYKACKPYADNAFNRTGNNDDVVCTAYFRAAADYGHLICKRVRDYTGNVADNAEPQEEAAKRIMLLAVVANTQGVGKNPVIQTAIQIFVNAMAKAPENWEYNASTEV